MVFFNNKIIYSKKSERLIVQSPRRTAAAIVGIILKFCYFIIDLFDYQGAEEESGLAVVLLPPAAVVACGVVAVVVVVVVVVAEISAIQTFV